MSVAEFSIDLEALAVVVVVVGAAVEAEDGDPRVVAEEVDSTEGVLNSGGRT